MENPNFAAVLFDMDGTLIRTHIDFDKMREDLREWAKSWEVTGETARTDDVLEIVARGVERVWKRDGTEEAILAKREAYTRIEKAEEKGCEKPEAIDGATELLQTLQSRGVRIGIVTRNAKSIASELLRRMDLPYDTLVARGDTPEFKPHPAPVRKACENLGVSPHNCAVVGDLWADIASGKAAGVARTVAIHWPYDKPDRFATVAPDVTVQSLREAFPYLLRTNP